MSGPRQRRAFTSLRQLRAETQRVCITRVEGVIGAQWSESTGRYLRGVDARKAHGREVDALERIEALRAAIADARELAAPVGVPHSSAAEIALRRVDSRLKDLATELSAYRVKDDQLTELQVFVAAVAASPLNEKFVTATELAVLWIASGGFPNIGADKWQRLDPSKVINRAAKSIDAAKRSRSNDTK